MYKVLTFLFFITMGYFVVRHIGVSYPQVAETAHALVQQGVVRPLQVLQEGVPSLSRLSDWIPYPQRRYTPNPYGYGGLDPEGGERKGGNGLGIPHAVDVGWWKGEEVTYPERKLSPVQDMEERPQAPHVADVGWWGDDWLA